MVIRTEKDRIKSLVIDTVKLLCKNGLPADCGFSIEGMIGVTSLNDEDDVFLIPIKEIINSSSTSDSESEEFIPSPNKKKRKNKSDNIVNEVDNSVVSNIKLEDLNDDSDSGDLVMVKEEPARQTDDQLMIPTFTPAVPIQHTVTQWQPNETDAKMELVSGSGVWVSSNTIQQCYHLKSGSKVVRKLVREVFPDITVLAQSSCEGKRDGSNTSALDRTRVEAIKDFVLPLYPNMEEKDVKRTITYTCMDARKELRKRNSIKMTI